MILMSAHRDTIKNNFSFEYKAGKFRGLLDNWVGMFIVTSLLIEDKNISLLEKRGEVGVFYGDSEEWGTITELPELLKEDIVIVVDVACGDQYKGIDFSLENISGIDKKKITSLKESLEWEAFKLRTKLWDGNPDDEDESFKWREKGHKVLSFIIPIESGGKNTGWHVDNCFISIEKVSKAKEGLKRLINYLL